MRLCAVIVMSLMWGLALAATVYKWVDEQGVTHYSDQPYPGAKKIDVQAAQTYTAPPPATQPAAASPRTASGSGSPPYRTCELFRPTPDEVLFNVSSITAKLRLDPSLRAGDKVAIALDGKRMTGMPTTGEEFTLTPVYRGTHTVVALVEDSQGKNVCQTVPVTFHVRQASLLAPGSPTRPIQTPPHTPAAPTRP